MYALDRPAHTPTGTRRPISVPVGPDEFDPEPWRINAMWAALVAAGAGTGVLMTTFGLQATWLASMLWTAAGIWR
jgi:hypothetical protein